MEVPQAEQAPRVVPPTILAVVRADREAAEFKRFLAANPLTEAQRLASDRAVAASKADGSWDAEIARRALQQQINERGGA